MHLCLCDCISLSADLTHHADYSSSSHVCTAFGEISKLLKLFLIVQTKKVTVLVASPLFACLASSNCSLCICLLAHVLTTME